jgi:SnoaL-like domain
MLDASTEPAINAFREAAERRELEPLLATLAPDVVIRSPVSERLSFEGIEAARELFGAVFEELGEFAYTDEFDAADARVLVYSGHLAGEQIEEVQLLRLAPDGKIRELTFFIRPLPALAGVAGGLAPRLARRRHGALLAVVMRAAGAVLKILVSFGDRAGSRLFG